MRDKADKLRLILIFCISQGGLRVSDQERLVRAAGLSNQDLTVLKNLELLGLSTHVSQDQKKLTAMFTGYVNASKQRMKMLKRSIYFLFFSKSHILRGQGLSSKGDSDDESEYANSRYAPALKGILSDLVQHKLSTDLFPSVLPMPEMSSSSGTASSARRRGRSVEGSARKSGATSRWSRTSGTEAGGGGGRSRGIPQVFTGGRSILFMVGGMSYSEVRVARDVMAKEQQEIVIGSTHVYTPKEFMEDIAKLKGGF
jgi:syntaxin-binding protein 1